MKILSAGWGEPPADVESDIAVNTSRVLARTKCGELHGYVYEDGRVPDWPEQQALQLGSEWHKALERLSYGAEVGEILDDYAGMEWTADKDGYTWEPFFRHALEAYARRYDGHWPGGHILATELGFWLLAEVVNERFGLTIKVLVRGRLDRACEWSGMAVNGEIKTVAAGTNMFPWFAQRAGHPQDALYYLALAHGPRALPNGAILPERVYGTRYDVTQKYRPPKGRKADKSDLPAAMSVWAEKLFHGEGIAWSEDRALKVAGKALSDYLALAGTRHRNYAACNTFGQCAYFDVCYNGLSLDSSMFKDREDDYVDEAL